IKVCKATRNQAALKGVKATAKAAKGAIKGYFFNPRIQYKDNVHNDGEVMRGTMNVITRLARTMNERLDAMIEVERYKVKLEIYGGYDMTYVAQRFSPVKEVEAVGVLISGGSILKVESWSIERGTYPFPSKEEFCVKLSCLAPSAGDCWAFSATGAIEGINKIVTGTLVSLSEQELCDCDKTYNTGCNGGLMDYAFKWVIENHGIDTEDDYPYQAAEKPCLKNKLSRRVVSIDGYTDVPANNEQLLLQAVAKQPVSVGICGSERQFQLYSKGIFSGPCSTSLDHAVLIVGYGSENGVDYWIVKNSWGQRWGINGYMHMLRNSGDSHGVCGINMMPSFPTKTTPNPPPSPGPSPTKCSLLTYCPAGSTCCCTWTVFGVCLSWSCCELDSAVCCDDHRYCCPHDYPVCDTRKKQCFKAYSTHSQHLGPAVGTLGSMHQLEHLPPFQVASKHKEEAVRQGEQKMMSLNGFKSSNSYSSTDLFKLFHKRMKS
ncbi:hypothetical protein Taro_023247, partial [Colocasia esculenta]|nr:hypothetical protein [Colocasia esculenta]